MANVKILKYVDQRPQSRSQGQVQSFSIKEGFIFQFLDNSPKVIPQGMYM